jgi:hypothetical protein
MKTTMFALIFTGMMFGCDETGTPERTEGERSACAFERFSVEITAGPSAPTMLAGKLYLAPAADGETSEYRGFFETADQQYAVNSNYTADGSISVSVALATGHVVGLGHVDSLCESDAMIEGVAVGPRVAADNTIEGSDSGHWLLYNGIAKQLKINYFDNGDGGYSDVIIKIPVGEVCTTSNAAQASCYESFCQGQMAGHYSADASGPICS